MSDEPASAAPSPDGSDFEVGYAKPRVAPLALAVVAAAALATTVVFLVLAPSIVTLMIAAMVAGGLGYFARRLPVARGPLDLEGDEVRFGGEGLASKSDLSAALVVQEGPTARVELRNERRALALLHLDSEEQARRLVRELGFEPGARVTRVEIPGSPWARAAALAVALGAAAFGGGELAAHARLPLAVLWAAFCMFAALLAQPLTKQRVEIGADGLRIASRGRARFVAFRDIQGVIASRGPMASLRLRLASGASLRLELGARPGANQGLAAGLADLVRQAKARSEATPPLGARLQRHGREPAAWLQELRALGAGADADHRRAPATSDALWGALTSPDSRGVERAAAAVALAGDPAQKHELLRVAVAVASPRVRVAISRAAEGAEDASIAEALLEIEREETRPRRRG